VEVTGGDRILREVQGLARDQGREGDHDEEWPARDAGHVPGVRDEDLQDRRIVIGAA
jgi:hypothetical protein